MPDWHYHANHVDAPARGSKAAAYKDARRLKLHALDAQLLHGDGSRSAETFREHGPDYPFVVRCFRSDCKLVRADA